MAFDGVFVLCKQFVCQLFDFRKATFCAFFVANNCDVALDEWFGTTWAHDELTSVCGVVLQHVRLWQIELCLSQKVQSCRNRAVAKVAWSIVA